MTKFRHRSANWLRRELIRGINDYLDEREDAADGCRKTIFIGPGGYRSCLDMNSAARKTLPAARIVRTERSPAAVSLPQWP